MLKYQRLSEFAMFCFLIVISIGCSTQSTIVPAEVNWYLLVSKSSNLVQSPESLKPEPIPIVKQPEIFFPELSHDFGKVSVGVRVVHKFFFANAGDAPLRIKRIRKSCGCTATNLGKKTINPGESSELVVVFNVGSRPGRRSRKITVLSNDPVNPKIVLSIAADVQSTTSSDYQIKHIAEKASQKKDTIQKPIKTTKEDKQFRITRRPRHIGR